MQNKIVRDKWVNAKIKVTRAGKILAKVAPAAVTGTQPKQKRAATKRAIPERKTKRRNPEAVVTITSPGSRGVKYDLSGSLESIKRQARSISRAHVHPAKISIKIPGRNETIQAANSKAKFLVHDEYGYPERIR